MTHTADINGQCPLFNNQTIFSSANACNANVFVHVHKWAKPATDPMGSTKGGPFHAKSSAWGKKPL